VENDNKLKVLDIRHNTITDDVVNDITKVLTIKKLEIYGNPISGEAIVAILQALRGNDILQDLYVPSKINRTRNQHKPKNVWWNTKEVISLHSTYECCKYLNLVYTATI